MPSYVLKNNVREYYKYVTEAFDFVKEGARSNSGWQTVSQGTNYLYGYSNAYEMGQNAGTSLVWTYNDTIPASTYTFNIKTNGQGNGYINNLTVTVTYDDSTTEVVYTNTESWNSDTLNEDFTFVASKPIKAIKTTGTLTHTSVNYVGIGITLTSLTHLGGQKSTSSDYDYYVYSTKSYILKRKPYMKYVYNDWQQPILTSNGTMGGDSFAVSAVNTDSRTQPYYAFDNNFANTYTAGWLSKASNNYLQWYNPNPLNISELKIQYQTSAADSVGYISNWILRASNDDKNYVDIQTGTIGNYGITTIPVQHNGAYKYWRLYPISWSSEWYDIINIAITAQEQIGIESTPSDYDYIGEAITYLFNRIKYRDVPNVTVVGSFAKIDKGVASGFSSADYLIMPEAFRPENNTWEMCFKVTTGSDVSTSQDIMGNYGNTYQNAPEINVYKGLFDLHIPKDGSNTKLLQQSGTYQVLANTTYFVKIGWTGTEYYLDYSTDGVDYIRDVSVANSTAIYQATAPFPIGMNQYAASSTNYWRGSIDLTQSYININNERWWSGVKAEKY